MGLSPRVRGNRRTESHLAEFLRSIPASAGEPSGPVHFVLPFWVYSRECGEPVSNAAGFYTPDRSIPASAGEPWADWWEESD